MNKKLFLMGIAATLMTACSENEPFDNSNGNSPITFDTYVGKQTRASQTTIDNLTDFGVYAYVKASTPFQLMDNEKISTTDGGTTWTYNNIKYWPENNSVDFFAYAPYKENWGDYTSATKSFTYTVPAASSAQEDLIAATSFQKNKGSNSGKVNLLFKHLLSKIGFSAKLAAEYLTAEVRVVNFEVLYKEGSVNSQNTFTFATSGDSSGSNEAGTWGTPADNQFLAGKSGELITDTVLITTDYKDLNTKGTATTPNTYLMMLPQNVDTGDIQAKITYTVTYTNPAAVVTNTKTIDLPAVSWVMGKAYTYNFSISMSQIIFDGITVDAWGEDSTQPAPTPVP